MTEPFRIIPGHPDSGVIIHVPHASRAIPADIRAGIVLTDEELERELDAMTDAFTDVIAERVADLADVRPWLFVNQRSRLVVDPERFPDGREEMTSVGMGAVYTRTSGGSVLRDPADDEISGLVVRYFDPYAAGFTDLVDERLATVGHVTIVDLHSFPKDALPYESCTATDPDRRSASGPTPRLSWSTPPATHSRTSKWARTRRSPVATCRPPTTARGATSRR